MRKTIRSFLRLSTIRRKPVLAVTFFLLAVLISGSIVLAARLKSGRGTFDVNHQGKSAVAGQRRVQVVSFTLYDVGIYPQQVRANPGRISISIEDLSGSSSGLTIERINLPARVPVGVLNKAANLLRARTELVLPQGEYELVDSTRPDNRALLIVSPDGE